MTTPRPTMYPSRLSLAAALQLAGFDQTPQPGLTTVTDVTGKAWPAPTRLLVALCVMAAESSGNTWALHTNTGGSHDCGVMQVNDLYYASLITSDPTKLNWAIYTDCCVMAHQIYMAADEQFTDWNSFRLTHPGHTVPTYLDFYDRDTNTTRPKWASEAIAELNAQLAAGKTLAHLAGTDLRVWS